MTAFCNIFFFCNFDKKKMFFYYLTTFAFYHHPQHATQLAIINFVCVFFYCSSFRCCFCWCVSFYYQLMISEHLSPVPTVRWDFVFRGIVALGLYLRILYFFLISFRCVCLCVKAELFNHKINGKFVAKHLSYVHTRSLLTHAHVSSQSLYRRSLWLSSAAKCSCWWFDSIQLFFFTRSTYRIVCSKEHNHLADKINPKWPTCHSLERELENRHSCFFICLFVYFYLFVL